MSQQQLDLDSICAPELQNFCRQLPKVELHAHLNGSIRDDTIKELASKYGVDVSAAKLFSRGLWRQVCSVIWLKQGHQVFVS